MLLTIKQASIELLQEIINSQIIISLEHIK